MRFLIPLLLTVALGAGTLSARELHTFNNPDKTKSFVGCLEAFDGATGKVAVRAANGAPLAFPITAVCKEDQDYIRAAAAGLALASKLTVALTESSERGEKESKGDFFVTPVDGGYKLNVANLSTQELADFEIRYRIYYSDAEVAQTKTKESVVRRELKFDEGSARVGKMGPGERTTVETKKVALTEVKQKPPSQCTGGG